MSVNNSAMRNYLSLRCSAWKHPLTLIPSEKHARAHLIVIIRDGVARLDSPASCLADKKAGSIGSITIRSTIDIDTPIRFVAIKPAFHPVESNRKEKVYWRGFIVTDTSSRHMCRREGERERERIIGSLCTSKTRMDSDELCGSKHYS